MANAIIIAVKHWLLKNDAPICAFLLKPPHDAAYIFQNVEIFYLFSLAFDHLTARSSNIFIYFEWVPYVNLSLFFINADKN